MSSPQVNEIVVTAVSAATSVGRGAATTAAAIRAGISGFGTHPFLLDTMGEPMRVARAPWLDIDVEAGDRFEALLFPTVEDALRGLPDDIAGGGRLALALGLPAPRPGLEENLAQLLRHRLEQVYPGRFAAIASFPVGHAAGLLGLRAAAEKLLQGRFDACIVAGVESWLDPDTLEWLESNDQLHGAGPLNNAWGFIPGEAAGACVAMTADAARRSGVQPLARLVGIGSAVEPVPIKTEGVCIGAGLTEAFRGALETLPQGETVTDVYCDMNGEPYRADEYGFTCLRVGEAFRSAADFIAPADCWGDVSAATGTLCIGLAIAAGSKGYAHGALAAVWASSEAGERAVVLLDTQPAWEP